MNGPAETIPVRRSRGLSRRSRRGSRRSSRPSAIAAAAPTERRSDFVTWGGDSRRTLIYAGVSARGRRSASLAGVGTINPVTEYAPENAMEDPGEIAHFYDRASDLMRRLLDGLA